MSQPPQQNSQQSSYPVDNTYKIINKPLINPNQIRIPDLQFPDNNSDIDFQTQSCKLIQANTILSELIKEHLFDKYRIIEKIIKVSEQIRKIENRGNIK